MNSSKIVRFGLLAAVMAAILTGHVLSQPASVPDQRARLTKAYRDGNFRDAYDGLRKLCLDHANDPRLVGDDLQMAVQCLRRLGRLQESDELLESTIEVHGENWRLLQVAAQQYMTIDHYGFMVAGEYERGSRRGGGKMVNSLERDRVRALQLMNQARPLAQEDDDKEDVSRFHLTLADQLLYSRGHHEAWRLQYLTNLDELPDFDEGYPRFRNFTGAPVEPDGSPVFHQTAKRWDDATTDGQRWRWALDQAVENSPGRLNAVRWQQAQFYQNQFGVQTMQQYGYGRFFRGFDAASDKKDDSGTYELHTLAENETIARLASGVKRFEIPDEFNFVSIYQKIADDPETGNGEQALNTLAQIFENRRQYPRAAEIWRKSVEQYGPGNNDHKKQRISQIIDPWGRFEPASPQPANTKTNVDFRFRNGKKLQLTAHAIKVSELLEDVKAYLKSDPGQLDWNQVNLGNIGHRLVTQNQQKYVGEQVAQWELALQPRENHFDRRITITTPLKQAGAYLVTAQVEDGNVSKIVLWVSDTAIVRKQLSEKNWYFVADADAGTPIAGANLEFFGYKQKQLGGRRFQILTENFAEVTDDEGQVVPDPRDLKTDYTWVVTARTNQGRLAYLGFSGVWTGRLHDEEYNAVKIFGITDRPVYRPLQSMHFKFWVRRAQYDQEDKSQFAGVTVPVELYNPQGEKLWSKTLQADDFGGIEGNWEIPNEPMLGVYRINVQARNLLRRIAGGGITFRVEEYKKPEYEVTVEAPEKPIMLGEKIEATIQAKYYFGSPVTNATVKYKITRVSHSQDWFPVAYWDWFYGPGYWWYGYDYPWYPGWHRWAGCRRPIPWWWHGQSRTPPEVVAERELEIGEDGTVEVEIDTALAKEIHGDSDHNYTITAEVRDQSRRTIVGTGNVLVARQPFKVYSWVDRGYYRAGDVIRGQFLAQTLDNKPVEGQGVLTLLKVTYQEKRKPIETPVRRWQLDTNDEGRSQIQIKASAKGQYRLAYKVTDDQGHAIEGGYLFTITGDGFDGGDYHFNELELIPQQREFAPGDTVELQINADRRQATVLLFTRPSNGVYLKPKLLRLKGKSVVEEIEVAKKDMPNFFVEAMTVYGGKVYTETKEIVVPPEKRVLDVAVEPSSTEYLPGEEATVKVKLTERNGEPFQGSTVVSIYDKAVEYVSGGSNVADIKEFFWKWRRRHNPSHQSSLARRFGNLTLPKKLGMSNLGVFGASVADDLDALVLSQKKANGEAAFGGLGGGGAMPMARAARSFAAATPPGAPMAAEGAIMADAAVADAGGAMASLESNLRSDAKPQGRAGGPGLVQPTVRTKFADTALWVGALETDAAGTAEVKLKMPENLTAWKINVWALGHGTKVGSAVKEVVTRKNLILRLQAPRFFVQKDEVVLSANVHNYLDSAKDVSVSLEIPGEVLESTGELTQLVKIPANGEKRVDWRVKVAREGEAVVRMKALTDEESDAMEMTFPAYVHGMLKLEAWAGTVRPEDERASVNVSVPQQRRVEQSVLEVRYSPTLAGAMIDALPYLVDYPYGCTEQTLNRFLPTVVTQKTLIEMGVDLAALEEKRTNLNAQELGDPQQRAAQWRRSDRNPVFNRAEVDRMVKDGLKRLTNMQNSDGGWGWFSGWQERSWPHTTAVVVHGLQTAQQNDVPLVPGVLEKGIAWLKRYQDTEVQKLKNAPTKTKPWKTQADNLDALVYMILVDADVRNDDMKEFLYRDRVELAVYSKAMFGLALHKQGEQEKLDMIMENIGQFLVEDEENETAFLRLPATNHWWYWYGSETEANAYYLKLLTRLDPKGKTAPRLVKYLLNNRKHATYWSSTRDTALCVEAFADFIRATGEMQPDMVVEIWLDGEKKKEVAITADNLFSFDGTFRLTGADVTDGDHEIEIRRRGQGPVYFNCYLTNFTLEDFITKAGLEIKVNRKVYKLVPAEKTVKVAGSRGQAVDQKVEKFERVALESGAQLVSGDLVEIELEFESKNDYEYIVFEDMKAAGFEPVEVRSGYAANGLGAYMELRDNRVAFFVRRLMRGRNSISYRMRAETPGAFSALPARASAMYAPELKANSDEMKLRVTDGQGE